MKNFPFLKNFVNVSGVTPVFLLNESISPVVPRLLISPQIVPPGTGAVASIEICRHHPLSRGWHPCSGPAQYALVEKEIEIPNNDPEDGVPAVVFVEEMSINKETLIKKIIFFMCIHFMVFSFPPVFPPAGYGQLLNFGSNNCNYRKN